MNKATYAKLITEAITARIQEITEAKKRAYVVLGIVVVKPKPHKEYDYPPEKISFVLDIALSDLGEGWKRGVDRTFTIVVLRLVRRDILPSLKDLYPWSPDQLPTISTSHPREIETGYVIEKAYHYEQEWMGGQNMLHEWPKDYVAKKKPDWHRIINRLEPSINLFREDCRR